MISCRHPTGVLRMGLRVGHAGPAVLTGAVPAGRLRALLPHQRVPQLAVPGFGQVLLRLFVSSHFLTFLTKICSTEHLYVITMCMSLKGNLLKDFLE
jgi:hypothetical protein